MKIEIKDAIVEDAEIISNIYALSWKKAYKGIVPEEYLCELQNDFWVQAFQNWISNKILNVKLICEDSTPVGCIAYGKSRDEKLAEWGEVVSIYIHPNYFRKGYGQKLLENALLHMKKDGYQNCYLWVLKENKNAQHFYERNGFKCSEDEYKFNIKEKQLIDIRYVIDLSKKL